MKKIVVILSFLISVLTVKAQQATNTDTLSITKQFQSKFMEALSKGQFDTAFMMADSVEYYAKKQNDLLTLASTYQAVGEVYKFKKEFRKDILYINKALPIYKDYNYKSSLVILNSSLASTYRSLGKLDSSFYYLQKADSHLTDTISTNAIHYLYNQKSIYYENQARLDSAIHYVIKRIKITDTANHYKISNANIRLSSLFFKVSDFEKSLVYINNALNAIDKSKRPLEISKLLALSNKFQILFKLNRHSEALAITDEILKLSKEQNRPDFEVFTKSLVSKFHFDNQKIKTKKHLLHDSIINGKKLSNRRLFRFHLTQLDQALELKDKNTANLLHKKLEALLPKIGLLNLKQSYYNLSSKYYKSVENYKSGLISNELYLDVSNQINERRKLYTFYDLETKYQTEKKDKEIVQQQLNLEKSQAKTKTMSILIISLLLGSILLWFIFQQRQKRIQQQLITIQKEQEVLTLESLIAGEEKERLRIAQELHDGVNGDLSAIKFKLSSLLKMNNEVINEAVTMIDNSCHQVRAISHNLVPPSLKDFNIIEAIGNYCENMNDTHQPDIQFQHIGSSITLNKKIEVNIFRIVQELVTNAIKHAEAKTITIQTSYQDETIQLTVEDDGNGFKTDINEANGIGLQNLKSRVDYLNADMDLLSNSEGTSYTITINTNTLNDN